MLTVTVGRSWLIAILLVVSAGVSAAQLPEVNARVDALLAEGLYEEAEILAATNPDLRGEPPGSLREAIAADALVRALILNGRGALDDTVKTARRALQIKEALPPSAKADLVPSLINLGDVLVEAADFEHAIAALERAVALCERSAGADSIATAEALDHLGSALSAARRNDDAYQTLTRSRRLKEKALRQGDVGIARTLEELGRVLQRKSDFSAAGAQLRRAANIQEAANSNHPAYVRTLNLIALQLWFEGRLLESKDVSERAIALGERTLRADHPLNIIALRYIAGALADLGDFARSVELKERALALATKNYGARHPITVDYLYGLALSELDQGAYAAARRHVQEALRTYEARYGPWHEYVATALSVLAETDAKLGDYATAEGDQLRTIEIYKRWGGPTHAFVAVAQTELARIYRAEGAPERALAPLQSALAIRQKWFGVEHREVAATLTELASALRETGRLRRAQEHARRAVEMLEKLDIPNAPEYARALALYADIQASRGDFVSAKDYYEKALAIRGKAFGTSHPSYAEAQSSLSVTLARLQDRDAALRMAVSAETTGREHLAMMLRSLPERQALSYAAARPRGLDLVYSLTASTPEAIALGFDGAIRSRALVLDEIAARQGAGRSAAGQTAGLWAAFTSAQQRLANLTVRGPREMSPAQYLSILEETRQESERAEQALADQSAEFRAERSRSRIGLTDVQTALPVGAALVSFVRYERSSFDAAKPPAAPGSASLRAPAVPSYIAFVLHPSGAPVAIPLGPAAAIDALVSAWRQGVASVAGVGAADVRPPRISGAALRRLVWDPIAPAVADAVRVFVVPDGTLNLVSLSALPVGRAEYLIERGPVLHYVSAERDLVSAAEATHRGQGLLAVGGPSFDDASMFAAGARPSRSRAPAPPAVAATSSPPTEPRTSFRGMSADCPSVQSMHFDALPASAREANDVASLWKTFGPINDGAAAAPTVLVARDASERSLKQKAAGYRVVHFATHGFFIGDGCTPASSGTRSVGGLISAKPQTRVRPPARSPSNQNPLLLSGLAMAGANRRAAASGDEDDGILTAEEVASLNLTGVEWVVLSACDTGLGEIKAGEGVLGLRRAFQIAGARTVIMSLWQVEDRSAMNWMRALYEGRLRRNLDTADAVREASLAVLRQRRARGLNTDPFFWAGFVASGDWR